MTQDFERPRERTTTAESMTTEILVGATVYDALSRPVGNVTDIEGDILHGDGRPEGIGFVEVPLANVQEVDDNGHVRLGLELDQIGRPGGVAWSAPEPD